MAEPSVDPLTSVTRRAVRAVAWTLPTSLGARAVGLAGTLVLARFLSPSEYGEVMAAAIVVMTANSVTSFGVGLYLVTNRSLTRAHTFHATCWFLGVGVVTLTATWAASGVVGAWFGAPELPRFVPLLVLAALLDRVAYVPERMAVRELRFAWISLARAAGELAFTVASVSLAALGLGGMAIVWGSVARSALRAAAVLPAVGWREWLEPRRLRLTALADVVGFGVNVTATSIANFAMRRWDNLLVSRYFGTAAMGAYNYAYNLADTPAVAVGEQIADVVTASFPHVDAEKRGVALRHSTTMLSVVMLPAAAGLGAVAPTLVEAFFDARWRAVGTMLVVLSVLSAARPMAQVVIGYFYASQRKGVVLGLEVLSLLAIVVAIPTVGRAGLTWTCTAVAAVFALRTLVAMWMVQRLDAIRVATLLAPLAMPFAACVAMVAGILAARPALDGMAPVLRLAVEVVVGAGVYLLGAALLFRSTSRDFLALVRSALSRG